MMVMGMDVLLKDDCRMVFSLCTFFGIPKESAAVV